MVTPTRYFRLVRSSRRDASQRAGLVNAGERSSSSFPSVAIKSDEIQKEDRIVIRENAQAPGKDVVR